MKYELGHYIDYGLEYYFECRWWKLGIAFSLGIIFGHWGIA